MPHLVEVHVFALTCSLWRILNHVMPRRVWAPDTVWSLWETRWGCRGGSYSPRDDCTTGEGARDVTLSSSERRSCTWTPANLHKYIVFILPLLFGLKEKNKQWDNQVKMGVLHACSHIAFFIGLSLDETFCSSKRDTIYCFYLIPICCVFDCSFFFFALANHLFPRHCSNTQTTREIASPSSKPW